MSALPRFTCPRCGAVSYHPKDIEHGYCGRCHDWTGDDLDAEARAALAVRVDEQETP